MTEAVTAIVLTCWLSFVAIGGGQMTRCLKRFSRTPSACPEPVYPQRSQPTRALNPPTQGSGAPVIVSWPMRVLLSGASLVIVAMVVVVSCTTGQSLEDGAEALRQDPMWTVSVPGADSSEIERRDQWCDESGDGPRVRRTIRMNRQEAEDAVEQLRADAMEFGWVHRPEHELDDTDMMGFTFTVDEFDEAPGDQGVLDIHWYEGKLNIVIGFYGSCRDGGLKE